MSIRRAWASAVLSAALLVPPGAVPAGWAGTDRAGHRAADGPGPVRVLAVSVDGLNPMALRRLGPARTPHLHRLLREGAATLNARSQVERTTTLPNHVSMVTGRRINAGRGGHGVTWNSHRARSTVQGVTGRPVSSVFAVVGEAGGSSAVFATEPKLSLFRRSWPQGVARSTIRRDDDLAVAKAARNDLVRAGRDLTFVHLGGPDEAGHARGFMSRAYLRAVRQADAQVGLLLSAVDRRGLDDVVVVLTADHGGQGANHGDARRVANHRVPFVVWGAGIGPADLYALNPGRRNPAGRIVRFGAVQPVRNGDLANLVTDLLGLDPVPGSLWNADQSLLVSAAARPASARG